MGHQIAPCILKAFKLKVKEIESAFVANLFCLEYDVREKLNEELISRKSYEEIFLKVTNLVTEQERFVQELEKYFGIENFSEEVSIDVIRLIVNKMFFNFN